jgi:hypothetical protein
MFKHPIIAGKKKAHKGIEQAEAMIEGNTFVKLISFPKILKKIGPFLDLCVSSFRRGHANLLYIVPILSDVYEETIQQPFNYLYKNKYIFDLKDVGVNCKVPRPLSLCACICSVTQRGGNSSVH